MLSVTQAAELLHVSSTRVRALIANGVLPAQKVGNAWVIREEDVQDRLASNPGSGRPRNSSRQEKAVQDDLRAEKTEAESLHGIYDMCKKTFSQRPSASAIASAESPEEASFYLTLADFFLQQEQRKLIDQGVY